MASVTLLEVAALLAALAIAAPLARWLGIGTVLGYLVAGVILGPYGVRHVFSDSEAKEILHIAEFGIVLLLFLIGLELRPKRLSAMRTAIFGLGGAQLGLTALALAAIAVLFGLAWQTALFAGLALALSSTAFALQVLEENGEPSTRHGRLGFAVLLFQDLAAIPLIALAPLFASSAMVAGPQMDLVTAVRVLGTIVAVVLIGHFALDHVFRLIARTRVRGDDGGGAAHRGRRHHRHAARRRFGIARGVPRRRASGRIRLPAPARGRHPAVRRTSARPVLHRDRHVARPAAARVETVPGAGPRRRPRRREGRRAVPARPRKGCRRARRAASGSRSARAASSASCCSQSASAPA